MSEYLYLPDQGDGTYVNPVILCDYSDPDAICVDGVYYMTASTFNYVPGLPILTSTDLVNWTLVNYALKNIPGEKYREPRHAEGVWAPSIRYHNGMFFICYGMPDEGIYMVRTTDPLGTWEEPILLLPGKGLIDSCPLWDDDGTAWVIHGYANSRIGFNSMLGIFQISPDGTRVLSEDHLFYDGRKALPTLEGPKAYKRNGWYYIFAPAGGVDTGWQVVLRSKKLRGPYESKIVLRQGSSPINGPHQGAWVETPAGEHWFLHFQSRGLYGRITHLQPMSWQDDDWPVMGQPDPTGEADCGIPVLYWDKPIAPVTALAGQVGTDLFDGPLGLQWQFMGNVQPDFYHCGDGKLRLYARELPLHGDRLWQCPQVCTQKLACAALEATTTLDASHLAVGDQAGVGLVGGQYAYVALRKQERGVELVYVESRGSDHEETVLATRSVSGDAQVSFHMTLHPTGLSEATMTFEVMVDGVYQPIGTPFTPERHTWVGARLALFAMPLKGGKDQGGYGEFGPFVVKPLEA